MVPFIDYSPNLTFSHIGQCNNNGCAEKSQVTRNVEAATYQKDCRDFEFRATQRLARTAI